MNSSAFLTVEHRVDVCVIGGGMAGLCAAVASARQGRKTVLVQDRPVLGGNASSEVRMWICGALGKGVKETGLLEELQLDNARLNPAGNYSLWDATLWHFATQQPNLTLLLNTAICDGGVEAIPGDPTLRRLTHVRGWQLTSQTWQTIEAKVFIDCSGDSVLAPISRASTRRGREARQEFDEDIQPDVADARTMGNTLLIQLRRIDEDVPFVAPSFAYRFDSHEQFAHRLVNGVQAHNFWWLELGGLQDTIGDAETIRDELMRTVWGVWDFIKNRSPHRADAANWAIEWVGALPGKRENRRYIGLHTLTQNEVRAGGADFHLFDDVVAYGGWSMDDHHPAGLLYPGEPTIFHPAPSPYVIPYRCLVSRDVVNLMMAGRNISVTHAALSSTRVMATCALLGQASGTAAALSIEKGVRPAQVYPSHVAELQARLQRDDVWLPGRQRPIDALSIDATVDDGPQVLSGHDRPVAEASNLWRNSLGTALTLSLPRETTVGGVRLVFDSNLANDKRMPCSYPQRHDRASMPATLARAFRIEVCRNGRWITTFRDAENAHRLRYVPLHERGDAVRVIIEQAWSGGTEARLFGFEAVREAPTHYPKPVERVAWSDVVARVDPADLASPAIAGGAAQRRRPVA
ncbi:MAG: FAD-dependent oxidoreductase [Tepidisphaeraceae bacterium]